MKRARAGSISGRLRSASDLEEKGLIDKSQKGVLKDLIISGDSELQAALDLYDRGDSSQLEGEWSMSMSRPSLFSNRPRRQVESAGARGTKNHCRVPHQPYQFFGTVFVSCLRTREGPSKQPIGADEHPAAIHWPA